MVNPARLNPSRYIPLFQHLRTDPGIRIGSTPELFPREQRGKMPSPILQRPTRGKRWSLPVEPDGEVMTTQTSNAEAPTELNAVIDGHRKFHYETMNGHTYAIGHINGSTVMVRVN